MLMGKKQRDISFIRSWGSKTLVIACDSSGAIGSKELDLLKVSPRIVGYYTTRVALMEILSVGATPLAVINTLSVEMNPTGYEIIEGIKDLLREAELPLDCINGSTEENFKTLQTGMGITIIGEVENDYCKLSKTEAGDIIYLLGELKVGGEIQLPHDPTICSLKDLQLLVSAKGVKEIIPVGSKGIGYEGELLAALNGLQFVPDDNLSVSLTKSGGPATAVIFSGSPNLEENFEGLDTEIKGPLYKIGKVIK
ncbi:AIR synthase related protein [Alkaliphilus transvaalensis]|uniref:AIR synthase related protein n=1 Tax=Alkaliphilus transvaalensis TaxID=114628 RepID=UPI0004795245|nr:AIR synthase related protein [Alkaliphilus transvaalensis]